MDTSNWKKAPLRQQNNTQRLQKEDNQLSYTLICGHFFST